MAVISLKLSEDLDVQLMEQAMEGSASPSAVDLLADLLGCCEGGPADLSSNPVHLFAEAPGFDPSLALQLIDRGVVPLPFVLQEQIGAVSSLFKRDENVPASLDDAALIPLAEINDSPLLLTTDRDFHIDRRHGRQTTPLARP
jgi:hypothetical protein